MTDGALTWLIIIGVILNAIIIYAYIKLYPRIQIWTFTTIIRTNNMIEDIKRMRNERREDGTKNSREPTVADIQTESDIKRQVK
jgi:hypothetical protein